MANLSAGSVTYAIQNLRRMGNSKVANRVKLTFGDSSQTYPAGGIPITIGKLGTPNACESIHIVDQGTSGYQFQYDSVNAKLVIIQSPSHVHNMIAIGGLTSSEALFLDASQSFGKTAATNRTIVGSTSATTGGVVAATIGAGAEATAVALAAQTLYVEVIGW